MAILAMRVWAVLQHPIRHTGLAAMLIEPILSHMMLATHSHETDFGVAAVAMFTSRANTVYQNSYAEQGL